MKFAEYEEAKKLATKRRKFKAQRIARKITRLYAK